METTTELLARLEREAVARYGVEEAALLAPLLNEAAELIARLLAEPVDPTQEWPDLAPREG
ncbi:MAG: hypothetical protein K6U89_01625 [Chloroflexi bacterium]|nr:hypothetical protein [Chloroflexota bacterium]GIW09284.1 MAG: hypothetical protein KatS3mg061_0341 [Dehalococcoidia bacterium]